MEVNYEDILKRVFLIRAKDDVGQYLDDEQEWQEGLEWTENMNERARKCIESAIRYVEIVTTDVKVSEEEKIDLYAEASAVFILRRRGGEEFRSLAKFLSEKLDVLRNRKASAFYITQGVDWEKKEYVKGF